MNISIIGKHGDLAKELQNSLKDHHVIAYSKEQYNFLNKNDIQNLADQIYNSDVIICCSGICNQDAWDSYLINTVAPIYLLEKLISLDSTSQVILLGSHAAMWTSWPGIDLNRLAYNNSKSALQSYIEGLDHSAISKLTLTMFNATRFQSQMSNYQGYPISYVVNTIKDLIMNPNPPLVYEMGKIRDDC